MKKIILYTILILSLIFNGILLIKNRQSIPIDDVAFVNLQDGYYQIELKDITHINDNPLNLSYDELFEKMSLYE